MIINAITFLQTPPPQYSENLNFEARKRASARTLYNIDKKNKSLVKQSGKPNNQ